MLQKNNRPLPEKKEGDVAWGKKQPTLLSWALMTPAERGNFALQWMMRDLRLFEKYGITDLRSLDCDVDNPWRKLALALAEHHEPDFSSRERGRPKEHDDDLELILMIELLRCRDGLSIPKACEAIAKKGAIKAKALKERRKTLMRNKHWKVFVQFLGVLKAKVSDRDWIEFLEEAVGDKIHGGNIN